MINGGDSLTDMDLAIGAYFAHPTKLSNEFLNIVDNIEDIFVLDKNGKEYEELLEEFYYIFADEIIEDLYFPLDPSFCFGGAFGLSLNP